MRQNGMRDGFLKMTGDHHVPGISRTQDDEVNFLFIGNRKNARRWITVFHHSLRTAPEHGLRRNDFMEIVHDLRDGCPWSSGGFA